MSEQGFKITDKRMFTPAGELKEEYQHLEEERARQAAEAPIPTESPAVATAVADPPAETIRTEPPSPEPSSPAHPVVELPALDPAIEAPGFFDLISVLAEPAAAYLGDGGPGGGPQDLEMARAYIDLLDVLGHKTQGNLTSEEAAVLGDVVYRLKMRYVQKRG